MNDYAMVDLVQGITRIHLKQTEMRDQPKCIEEQVISWTFALSLILTTSKSLSVGPAIIAELHHWSASSWYSCRRCFNCLYHSCRRFGFEFRIDIQVRLGRTLATMTSTYSLQRIITHYCIFESYTQYESYTRYVPPDPAYLSSWGWSTTTAAK